MKLITVLALCASSVFAAPYIVTQYIELSVYTEDAYTDFETTYSESLFTYTEVVASLTGTAAPLSTITASSYDDYDDVTLINIVVPTGIPIPDNYDSTSTETSYVVNITYTPSATCTSQNWTYVTAVPIYVPAIVSLTPVTVSTSLSIYSYYDAAPTPYTAIIGYLNPTDVDASDLAAASSEYAPGMDDCYTPTTYCGIPSATSGAPAIQCTTEFVAADGYDTFDDSCSDCGSGLRDVILICVLVPVGFWLIMFVIGLWESWLSFKGLMLGKHRKRGTPYSWCCINWLFLCCVGPTYKAKSVEEQAVLKERWKEMKAGEKCKLWVKWGFRWKYPDVLGEEPEVAKRAPRQGCL